MVRNYKPYREYFPRGYTFNCPLFVPIYPSDDLDAADFDKIEERELTTNIYRANVIILNQACDLEVRDGQDSLN